VFDEYVPLLLCKNIKSNIHKQGHDPNLDVIIAGISYNMFRTTLITKLIHLSKVVTIVSCIYVTLQLV